MNRASIRTARPLGLPWRFFSLIPTRTDLEVRQFPKGDKVKVTLRFRGREMAHQELGYKLLDRVKGDTAKIAKIEQEPRFEGRQVVMVLAPR